MARLTRLCTRLAHIRLAMFLVVSCPVELTKVCEQRVQKIVIPLSRSGRKQQAGKPPPRVLWGWQQSGHSPPPLHEIGNGVAVKHGQERLSGFVEHTTWCALR